MLSVSAKTILTMAQLFAFILVAIGCVSTARSFHLTESAKNLPSNIAKIINGVTAEIRDFPYIVSLQYNGTFYGHSFDHYCCGSILNEDWVITTAQCGKGRAPSQFHIRAGSRTYYEGGDVYNIERVVIHPNFNELSRDFDVALIKLSKKIIFNANIQPVSLPINDEPIQESIDFTILGWGATEILGKMSDELYVSHIQKITNEECSTAYVGVTNRMFCVFTRGIGPCVGDSGSPAVSNNQIIGLASWSYGCAYENPTVYAKVSSVLRWIKDTTGITSSA